MTYDQWFRSQQGIPYEGAYLFAEAAWEAARADLVAEIERKMSAAEFVIQRLAAAEQVIKMAKRTIETGLAINETLAAIKEWEKSK